MQKLASTIALTAIASLAPALAAAPATSAPAPQIKHVYVTEAGQYIVSFTRPARPSTGAPAAPAAPAVAKVQHLQDTSTIHLQPDLHFGFRYSIVGTPEGAPVDIRFVTIYPKPGVQKPGAAAPVLRDETTWSRSIGNAYYCGFTISHDWQMIPGDWTFEIWHGDQKLASQTFTLVP